MFCKIRREIVDEVRQPFECLVEPSISVDDARGHSEQESMVDKVEDGDAQSALTPRRLIDFWKFSDTILYKFITSSAHAPRFNTCFKLVFETQFYCGVLNRRVFN